MCKLDKARWKGTPPISKFWQARASPAMTTATFLQVTKIERSTGTRTPIRSQIFKYLRFFSKESKVSSELVAIQEPASLVKKEGTHLPTGKYQIPVVIQKNTKIWANVQCGGRTCPIFILSYPFSPNSDKNDYSFIEINMHTKSFKDDIYKLYNYTKKM